MKQLFICAIGALMLANTACTKKQTDCCTVPDGDLYISGKLNNTDVTMATEKGNYQDTTFVFGRGAGEKNIVFKLTQTPNGAYAFHSANFYITVGGDVMVAEYKLVAAPSNSFSINTYMQNNTIAEGNFNLTFARTYGNPAGAYPDTLKYTGGKFKVRIK
jgi:hypothetical protein